MIRGITFLGIRTEALAEMKAFFSEVLGMQIKHEEADFVAFRTPNGDRVELFGMNKTGHEHFDTGPVGGFEVSDIMDGVRILQKNDIHLLTGIMGKEHGTQWVHFRGPDGNVYELVHHSSSKSRPQED